MKDKDFKLVKKLTTDIFKIKQEMALDKIDHNEKRWKILTAEQQEKAEELRRDHHPMKRRIKKK